MPGIKCECGRYAKFDHAILDGFEAIKEVWVNCSRCGLVKTTQWACYEQIMGWD